MEPTTSSDDPKIDLPLLNVLRKRRVTRQYQSGVISREELLLLAEAAYWAPSGGNRRPLKYVFVTSEEKIRLIMAFSPGIYSLPGAIISICIDWDCAPHLEKDDPGMTHSTYVDVGAAMQNILLVAEMLNLGACPVMSFHRESIKTLLRLPGSWSPYLLLTIGYRKKTPKISVNHDSYTERVKNILWWDQYDG